MQFNINTMAPMDLMGYRQLLESELGQLQQEAQEIMKHVAQLSGTVKPNGMPQEGLKKVDDAPEEKAKPKKLTKDEEAQMEKCRIKAQQLDVKMKYMAAKIAKCRKKLYE